MILLLELGIVQARYSGTIQSNSHSQVFRFHVGAQVHGGSDKCNAGSATSAQWVHVLGLE
jgi:hypothetical protein